MKPKKSNKANLEQYKVIFFQIGLVIVLSLTLTAFEWNMNKEVICYDDFTRTIDDYMDEHYYVKPPEPPKPKQPVMPESSYDLIIKADDEVFENEWEFDEGMFEPDAPNYDYLRIPEEIDEEVNDDPFVVVEEMPVFQGKMSFRAFIASNIKYPELAIEHGISGVVYVKFVVNKFGKVVNVSLIRGVSPELDREALRVVSMSPDWTPGRQMTKKVNVQLTVPVRFVLN